MEASNAVKNKLFSIIAHDLRSPFNSLISIFSLKDMDLLSFDELKMLLNENRKNIETIHNTLDNLLHWAKSEMEGIKTSPSVFQINSIIDELLLIYTPLMHKKGIIPNVDAEKILNRDVLEATPGTAQEKGVGLGLLLCREYVKSNGGDLNIQQVGNEVLFSFQLPKFTTSASFSANPRVYS